MKNTVLRRRVPKAGFKLAPGNEQNFELIGKHIERHLGRYSRVFHEIVSDLVHIDVHIVPPSKKRPFYTLVTSGMSDRPMTVPKGAGEFRYAELMLCLPPDWPMEEQDWKHPRHYWPIEFLKFLARMPHQYATWLYWGHTIPHDETARCFPGTKFCCAFIGPPSRAPEKFQRLKVGAKKTINFYAVYLLYREEMELKMEQGVEALCDRLEAVGATELVEVKRKNGAK